MSPSSQGVAQPIAPTSGSATSWFSSLFPYTTPEERYKMILLSAFKFVASFVFVILTSLKEPSIILHDDSCAEVLPVLRSVGVLIVSIAFVLLYSWMANRYHPTKIFFWVIMVFALFFIFYVYYFYPKANSLMPHATADRLLSMFPQQKHWIAMYRYWPYALSFSVIELYGQVVIVMVFWSIANELYTRAEAKRFYHVFIIYGSIGGLVACSTVIHYLHKYPDDTTYEHVVNLLLKLAIVGLFVMLALYGWMYYKLFPQQRDLQKDMQAEHTQLSLWESLKYVLANPYLIAVATLVITSAVTISLVDVTFKSNLKELYPTQVAYQLFTTKVTAALLVASILTAFSMGGYIMRVFGWKASSYVMPVVVLTTGSLFFLASKFRGQVGFVEFVKGWWGVTDEKDIEKKVLHFIVFLGVFQNLMSKLAKYVFFDTTKEMVYIGLDIEARRKGKAAIDTLGSRIGKSLSGLIHILVLFLWHTPKVLNLTHILLVCLLALGIPWFYAINYLDKAMTGKTKADN